MNSTYEDDEDICALKIETDILDVGDEENQGLLGCVKLPNSGRTLLLGLVAVQLQRLDAMKLQNLYTGK